MDAIVSVTSDWAIGKDGTLIVPNGEDMRRFRKMTTGGTIICGRVTFDSFRNGALPGRLNVIITRNDSYGEFPLDVIVAHDPQDAVGKARRLNYGNGKIWVIGGASIYRNLLPLCDNAYVTMNDVVADGADAFFPNLEEMPEWRLEEEQGSGVTADGISFRFLRYGRCVESPDSEVPRFRGVMKT